MRGSVPNLSTEAGTTAAAGTVAADASSTSVTTHCQRQTARDSEGSEAARDSEYQPYHSEQ